MSTSDLGRLQGTPWHVGFVKKKENDPKRHRSRCSHYRTDGSCAFHSHCIGSAHCMDYEDAILKKQKAEYKANRKTWQELAPKQTNERIVQIDDVVKIYSFLDKQFYELDFRKPLNELPALHKECLGRTIGTVFQFRRERYRIDEKYKTGDELEQSKLIENKERNQLRCIHVSNKGNCKICVTEERCTINVRNNCKSYEPKRKQ